jgi:hypothetical protein
MKGQKVQSVSDILKSVFPDMEPDLESLWEAETHHNWESLKKELENRAIFRYSVSSIKQLEEMRDFMIHPNAVGAAVRFPAQYVVSIIALFDEVIRLRKLLDEQNKP